MRPIELVVEGFGPFRDQVTIDFTEADFFALVGPTGAGKSSVIDAICFALYGMVPRYDDKRLVAPAITIGAQQAKIQFSFEAGGQRYVVTRVVRRTAKGATTKECRLERPAAGEVLAGDPDGVTAGVQGILGLTPEHFTRCVVLPQGDFAKFLHDKPAERQKLLVELLGLGVYGRMASAARARATAAKAQAEALTSQLADLAGATAEAEREAADRLAELRALAERAREAKPAVDSQRLDIAELDRQAETQRDMLERLRRVHVPQEVDELSASLALADQTLERARATADTAESAAQHAEAAVSEAPEPGELQTLTDKWAALGAEQAKLPDARAGVEAAAAALQAATQSRETAERAAVYAAARRAELDDEHAAHALAASLVVGRDCPVCLTPVQRIPDRQLPADLKKVRSEVTRLEGELRAVRATESAANAALVGAQGKLSDLQARCAGLASELAGMPDRLSVQAELARVRQLRDEATRLRREATQAKTVQAKAESTRNDLHARQQQFAGAYTRQRDALSAMEPPAPTGALAEDWNALARWAADRITGVETAVTELTAARESHLEALIGILSTLTQRCRRLSVTIPAALDYEQIVLAVNGAEVAAKADHDLVRDRRRRLATLQDEQGRLRGEGDVANTLGQLLSARGFESWVLAEALTELVAGASVTLRELSQGAYSLALSDSGEFLVIDHREAEASRPAKTLSGGETFQASLALALALADHLGQFAAGGSSQLESIFLDEGFGTLDEDSLEVVAATLETLASKDRVVGLVTHVKELAQRVPVRFEVRKTGRTAVVERTTA